MERRNNSNPVNVVGAGDYKQEVSVIDNISVKYRQQGVFCF